MPRDRGQRDRGQQSETGVRASLVIAKPRRFRYYAGMSRPLRIEFAGALYHVMSRGNERTDIVRHFQRSSKASRSILEPMRKTGNVGVATMMRAGPWQLIWLAENSDIRPRKPPPHLGIGAMEVSGMQSCASKKAMIVCCAISAN